MPISPVGLAVSTFITRLPAESIKSAEIPKSKSSGEPGIVGLQLIVPPTTSPTVASEGVKVALKMLTVGNFGGGGGGGAGTSIGLK
ncbi:unnamed protein product [marine sediment metagenome]|uniref:Uncharacterized protein n=1 Tax=marine sediment metagenome TaxID=412755 RepID=X1E7Y9_9ZZZZ